MRHQHPVQLRWSDPDMLGHLNHARALSLVEDARVAMTSEPVVDGGVRGGGFILRRLEVDYLRQLYYRPHEHVQVETWVTRLGTKSVTLQQDLRQDAHVALSAVAVLVAFDFETDSSRPFTEDERAFWTTYLE
ncbi:acyl-CoA thioesterase [Modestobacter sp. I12A-02628]|uniref:Acyl-CoA thioesterase n=1 Tax=Goekera deserti TaxID=2497753 RepID=A0A7K3WAS1_9ACTN|nr:thioesterase family protein [Goekera deserti]MPQ97592.1 acyl-CoA thioesterase [Goekera deserti]NDI47804.1 acyl-CoA thioesterase [Goekera deserti]NEL53552.1 acyl-CoA thioesterase [Goekera deserti]